jgi:uncharacterized protein DUF6502
MPQSRKRDGLASSASSKPLGSDSNLLHVELHLARILLGLAHLLLRHGYGHARLAKLAKLAFIDAAKSVPSNPSAKANIARIAALTGLTRVEVSRLLRADRSSPFASDDHLNRATRVASGWRTDKAFIGRSKKPRALSVQAAKGGFSELVKKYSGDIPARAMLVEMIRLGLVNQSRTGLVTLMRDTPSLSRSTIEAIRAISPWVDLLATSGNVPATSALTSDTQQIRIHFDSISEVLAALRELKSRQRSFVAGLQQLGTKVESAGAYEIAISVAIATAKPLRSTRRKN